MRLLVISDLYPPIAYGGYERSCAVVVDGLRDRHQVVVLTSDLRRVEAPDDPWVRRELPWLGPARREALRVPAAAVKAAAITRRVLAEVRPDAVYVCNCLCVSQVTPLIALQSGVPVVHRLSELWFASSLYRSDRFVGHLVPSGSGLRRGWSTVVGVVNRHVALGLDPLSPVPAGVSWCSDDLRGRVTLPPAIEPVLEHTIHPGVARTFAVLPRRPSAPPTIAYAGRVTTAKGAEVAVRALAALRADHAIEARLVLAGRCEREMAAELRRLARDLGVGAAVELAGVLDTHALGRLFTGAAAAVVPTVTHEAFGRVCVEAALARVPVVAARVGGIPEALRDGEHALLFPPGDAGACAAALAATLRDPDAAGARADRAYRHAERFSVERFVAGEEAFLEHAAAVLGRAA
ncbi:MAG TPA: glycosyltransferase [Solirubrobacteraceae bacterium]|nr:glycosyltransferase [Solirubrobacteraceae bacterium]